MEFYTTFYLKKYGHGTILVEIWSLLQSFRLAWVCRSERPLVEVQRLCINRAEQVSMIEVIQPFLTRGLA